MSTNSNNDNDKAGIGILALVAICYFYKTIIAVLKLLLVIGLVGAIIYALYMLNKRTRFINNLFDKVVDRVSKSSQPPTIQAKTEQPQENSVVMPVQEQSVTNGVQTQISELKSLVLDMKSETERQRTENQVAVQNAVIQAEKESKAAVLTDIFGATNNVSINERYSRSDEFERQRYFEGLRKKQEELEIRELKHATAEQLFKQDVKIQEVKFETQLEVGKVRQEMNAGFLVLQKAIMDVDNKVMTLTVYMGEKFNQLEMAFFKEIATVKEDLYKFKADVSNQFADVRLQFGQEILRLDQQQVRIVEKVGSLHHTVKMFGSEMVQMRNEFDRGQIRAEELLSRASLSYEKQQLAIQSVSKDVNIGLQQMSLYKQDFANEVGSATLKLEKISTEQYFALKDVAYEKMGITMLRNEYDQRVTLEQTKMSNLIAEQRRVEERIQERISRGQESFELKHQLHMTRENLQYSSNRFNLLQQEASVIRRQTK